MKKTARQTAFELLNKIQRDNSYSNLALDAVLEKTQADINDKRLISALVYGVVERKITVDYELSLYLSQPLKKLKPQVLTILRMGAYQLLFMDKIPASAAINESVKLAKNNQAAFASGLVNAVLHKIDSNGLKLPENNRSVKYSCPDWLIDMWDRAYGQENTNKLLESSFGGVETVVRVNTLRTDSESLIEKLSEEGIKSRKSDTAADALIIENGGALHRTKAYADGLFHVQDTASQLCCQSLDVREGDTVLDICSAPGGKSFTLAQMMKNNGRLYSFDVYDHRLKLIENGAERLGITCISTMKNDGSVFNDNIPFADRILCDVPCAGLGVIRKKPEIRYKESAEVDKLPDLQYSILCTSAKYLKNEGILVYSTCSLNPDENEKIIERFLSEHNNFSSVRVLDGHLRYGENTDCISLMPHIHNCDGFFIAAIKKIKDV
ncbi:MAG: 16S rRNA (cytosine(967)-C(5))-methyltransferase RsmB [Clostridia bacterium]|nr:16S rRNA (cytosine(967)-C(5))-methyltransferase RsmB [Clostridia bacterium]